jgi:hypothetical protein
MTPAATAIANATPASATPRRTPTAQSTDAIVSRDQHAWNEIEELLLAGMRPDARATGCHPVSR